MPEFKLFSLEEAERTLPLVRRIVQDLTAEYPVWRAAVSRFELLTGDSLARLEMVRGPQSALWGSEALGGVVALETADPIAASGLDVGTTGVMVVAKSERDSAWLPPRTRPMAPASA